MAQLQQDCEDAIYSHCLSVSDRLKVASYLWRDADTRGKQNSLLQWTCDEICTAYNKKRKSPPTSDVCSNLWKFLSILLQTVYRQEHEKALEWRPEDSIFTYHFFQSMIEAFSRGLVVVGEDGSGQCIDSLVTCLRYVMMGSPLPSVLFKFELVVSLLELLLRVLSLLQMGKHCPFLESDEFFSTLSPFLVYFAHLQGSQGNQKKMFIATTTQLLEPVLNARSLLAREKNNVTCENILKRLDTISLQLFNRDNLTEFTSAVSSPSEHAQSQKQTAASYARVLFQTLERIVTSGHTESRLAVIEGAPHLLNMLLIQNSHHQSLHKNIEFKFFQRLVYLLSATDISIEVPSAGTDGVSSDLEKFICTKFLNKHSNLDSNNSSFDDPPHLARFVLSSLYECLQLLVKYNVYRPGEDRESGGGQTIALEKLTLTLLKSVSHQTVECSLKCLSAIQRLNHKLVEPWLAVVWLFLFTACHEEETFALVCVETYSKLRQLPFLFGKCLQALDLLCSSLSHLKVPLLLPTSPTFQLPIESSLAKQISLLPPGQCIEILDLLCQYFSDRILLNTQCSGGEPSDDKCSSPKTSFKCLSLSKPPVIKLVPSLEKAVDIVRVFLTHVPSLTWTGRYKEKGVASLCRLYTQVCLPSLNASYVKGSQERLSSIFLSLTCECCELMAKLASLGQDLIPRPHLLSLVWLEDLQLLVPESWQNWLSTPSNQLDPLRQHLLTRLGVVWLRNHCRWKSQESTKNVVDFIFQALPEMDQCSSPWTGQPFAIGPTNCGVGYWSLIFTYLPLLSEYTCKSHLTKVARGIVMALHHVRSQTLLPTTHVGSTVSSEIFKFFNSEVFSEMALLHECLLSSTISLEKESFLKSFPKPLRKCLLSVCDQESVELFDESFTKCLSAGLQTTLDSLGERSLDSLISSRKKLDKWLTGVATSFLLLKPLPLRSLGPLPLQRVFAVVLVWHSTLTLTVLGAVQSNMEHVFQSALSLLVNLNYYLGWVVQCLSLSSKFPSSSRKSKSKSKYESQSVSICFSSLMDLLLEVLFKGSVALHGAQDVREFPGFSVSVLVTMEMALGARIRVGGYPHKLNEIAIRSIMSDSSSDMSLPERWLLTSTEVFCKAYGSTSSPCVATESMNSCSPLEHLSGAILTLLEHKFETEMDFVLYNHPLLVCSLLHVHQCRDDISSARLQRVVLKLSQDLKKTEHKLEASIRAASDTSEDSLEKMNLKLNQLCGVVDLLTLSSLLTQHDHKYPLLEAGTEEAEGHHLTGNSHTTWSRLHSSLKHSLTIFLPSPDSSSLIYVLELLTHDSSGTPLSPSSAAHKDTPKALTDERRTRFTIVCKKVSKAMKAVVGLASQDQLEKVLESLLSEDLQRTETAGLFCYCWALILGCKLRQEHKEGIRKHLSRVAVSCCSIATVHKTDVPLVFMSVQLLASVVSIPSPNGLDYQSSVMSLQVCPALMLSSSTDIWKAKLVGATAELVVALCRQHDSAVINASAPVITGLIMLVRAVVTCGQDLTPPAMARGVRDAQNNLSHALTILVHSAGMLSRALDMVSHQKAFCKFISPILYEFVVAVHKQPLHPDVKGALLPGVFNLLKLCSPGDIAFIKSSLDPSSRDSCQALIDEYKQYYKFGGKV